MINLHAARQRAGATPHRRLLRPPDMGDGDFPQRTEGPAASRSIGRSRGLEIDVDPSTLPHRFVGFDVDGRVTTAAPPRLAPDRSRTYPRSAWR